MRRELGNGDDVDWYSASWQVGKWGFIIADSSRRGGRANYCQISLSLREELFTFHHHGMRAGTASVISCGSENGFTLGDQLGAVNGFCVQRPQQDLCRQIASRTSFVGTELTYPCGQVVG